MGLWTSTHKGKPDRVAALLRVSARDCRNSGYEKRGGGVVQSRRRRGWAGTTRPCKLDFGRRDAHWARLLPPKLHRRAVQDSMRRQALRPCNSKIYHRRFVPVSCCNLFRAAQLALQLVDLAPALTFPDARFYVLQTRSPRLIYSHQLAGFSACQRYSLLSVGFTGQMKRKVCTCRMSMDSQSQSNAASHAQEKPEPLPCSPALRFLLLHALYCHFPGIGGPEP